ncbi:hypothetical protein Tco_0002062 [Tanacetum coccineum]
MPTMPKSNNDKKNTNAFKRIARISVRACYFVKSPPSSPPYQHVFPSTKYQKVPLTTPIESPPPSPIAPPGFSLDHPLNTHKSTPPPLISPPPAPSQPSKHKSPLAINLEPFELIFFASPTSPHPFFDSLEDLPLRIANPPPPQPTFESIERLEKQPPPIPEDMEPSLPPLPPQLPPLNTNNAFPILTHEMFCEHCQRR